MNPNETPAERKPYDSPKLEEHGSVDQLTQAGSPFGVAPGGPVPSGDADESQG